IVQTSASSVIQANNIYLSSQNGNIGTVPAVPPGGALPNGSPINVNVIPNASVPGTLSVNVSSNAGVTSVTTPNVGEVNISNSNAGGVTLNGVLTAGDFELTTAGGLTVATASSVRSTLGGITLECSGSAAAIAINGDVIAGAGPAIIEND